LNSWGKKRSVANRYNITSKSYDEQYAQEQVAKYCAAQKVLSPSCGGDVVLDVGCGSGLFFSYVADKASLVIGVDISHNLLLKAKVHTKTFCNVHIIQADADYLPFKNVFFDMLYAFTMLQNMPSPKQTLLEFKRQTKNDGKLVITGLKKIFDLTTFLDLIEANALRLFKFIDDPNLKCYIAIVLS
jgi:ubiquinone/menaquinone biosynthesis C-methylase UbiE